jgi:hypothetical protein
MLTFTAWSITARYWVETISHGRPSRHWSSCCSLLTVNAVGDIILTDEETMWHHTSFAMSTNQLKNAEFRTLLGNDEEEELSGVRDLRVHRLHGCHLASGGTLLVTTCRTRTACPPSGRAISIPWRGDRLWEHLEQFLIDAGMNAADFQIGSVLPVAGMRGRITDWRWRSLLASLAYCRDSAWLVRTVSGWFYVNSYFAACSS